VNKRPWHRQTRKRKEALSEIGNDHTVRGEASLIGWSINGDRESLLERSMGIVGEWAKESNASDFPSMSSGGNVRQQQENGVGSGELGWARTKFNHDETFPRRRKRSGGGGQAVVRARD